jgi:flagellar assembly protein FliH
MKDIAHDRNGNVVMTVGFAKQLLADFELELEEARRNGYDDGWEAGYDYGYDEGGAQGHQAGFMEGVNDGYDDGYEDGFSDGEENERDSQPTVESWPFDID